MISATWQRLSAAQRRHIVIWTIVGVALLTFAQVGLLAVIGALLTPRQDILPALTGAIAGQAYITYLKLRDMPPEPSGNRSDS